MNFIELLKQGKVKPDEIDDYIDKWHDEYSGSDTLEDYLGMTEQQYNEWVANPDSIDSLYGCERQREVIMAKELVKIAKELLE